MKRRRGVGATLGLALILMVFLALLCAAVFALSNMNVNYDLFFERRSVLKQATQTFAEGMVSNVRTNAESWWEDDTGLGTGECIVPIAGKSPMRFSYVISPDATKIYNLFVKGEYYPGGDDEDFACGVSVDINLASASSDVWSDSVFLKKR